MRKQLSCTKKCHSCKYFQAIVGRWGRCSRLNVEMVDGSQEFCPCGKSAFSKAKNTLVH